MLRPLPKILARSARVSVNAAGWCRGGAGSPLPWLTRVPQGAFVMPVGLPPKRLYQLGIVDFPLTIMIQPLLISPDLTE